MKKIITSLAIIFSASALLATPDTLPSLTEDSKKAEENAQAQSKKRIPIEQRREELKKKHQAKKKAREEAKLAAEAAKVKAAAEAQTANNSSSDFTSAKAKEAVEEVKNQMKEEGVSNEERPNQ